jgi:hypothetical protein
MRHFMRRLSPPLRGSLPGDPLPLLGRQTPCPGCAASFPSRAAGLGVRASSRKTSLRLKVARRPHLLGGTWAVTFQQDKPRSGGAYRFGIDFATADR